MTIAIVDTGVDTGHPDLASKIRHNPGEILGNAVDDDGNGLVDDWEGWDFGTGDNDPNPQYTVDASGIDVGFHGTFCGDRRGGDAQRRGNRGSRWNCGSCRSRWPTPDSGITSEALAGAFAYAVDQGASVISLSLGGPGDPGVPEFFQSLVDRPSSRERSASPRPATTATARARIPPRATTSWPSAPPTNRTPAPRSRTGDRVDVAAPGSFMWSSICRNYTFTELDQLIYVFFFGWDIA